MTHSLAISQDFLWQILYTCIIMESFSSVGGKDGPSVIGDQGPRV